MHPAALSFACFGLLVAGAEEARAQLPPIPAWAAQIQNDFRVLPNVPYLTAETWTNRVDLYLPRNTSGPTPVVLMFHGGGWIGTEGLATKEGVVLRLLPYMEMGFAVVNVGYRVASVSLAPAAVEDGLCALRWVARKAKQYGFDPSRIVVTGNSGGGHLALTTGMIPDSAGLDRRCAGAEALPKVSAIINWYGITDVADVLEGPNMKLYARQWLGGQPDSKAIARLVSPLTYVRPGP